MAIVSNNKKLDTALKTISEVSNHLEVPQHVLRFWESKFSEIKPQKLKGSRRYYSNEDVAILQKIKNLLYTEGYTIKGVQKSLKGSSKKLNDAQNFQDDPPNHSFKFEKPDSKSSDFLNKSQIKSLKKILQNLKNIKAKYEKTLNFSD